MIEQLKQLIQSGLDRLRDALTPPDRRAPAVAPVRSDVPNNRR
jgi:hypothetical protein